MKYEYVIYAGEGTLIEYGIMGLSEMLDEAAWAIIKGYSIQLEPAPDNCETGQ